MAVNTASLVMVAPATASTPLVEPGLGQLVCQSFSSGAAQFGSLAGCIDLHTGHPAAGDGDGDGHVTQAA